MLRLANGILEMQRAEPGRRRQQDHVRPAVDGVLVGVEADETPLFRYIDAIHEPIDVLISHLPSFGKRRQLL